MKACLDGVLGIGLRVDLSGLTLNPCNSDWGISSLDLLTPNPDSLLRDDDVV
jgi:hypothetical protein